jgi:CRP-like cAMP-binding protein/Zn-dependent protease
MADVWETLERKLDFGSFVPVLVPGIERADMRKRDGTPYTMLKNPAGDRGAGTYVTLDEPYVPLYELIDGKRTTSEILIEHLQRQGYLAVDRLAYLIANLGANGFFGRATVDVYGKLRRRKAMRDPLTQLQMFLRRLITWNIASWENAEGTIDLLYRAGGRLAFTRIGAVVVGLIAVWGLVVWYQELVSPRHDLFRVGGSVTLGILALTLSQVIGISVHEAGHALAIRHFGRHVRRLGLAIYYLFPCAYVDSTDMVMAPRGQRVVVALAGPIAGAAVAAVATYVAVTTSEPVVAALAFKGATVLFFNVFMNLLPILDLDGYHVLVDALDAPLLRQRALAFARSGIIRKVRRRERWAPSEVLLGLYGGLALGASIATLVLVALTWRARVAPIAAELAKTGPFGLLALAVILLVFVGPLLVQIVMRFVGLGRTALRAARAPAGRDERAVLAERVGILARVRFLANLTPQALTAIADHIREERVDAGAVVVTYGEPADKFYIVRSGKLDVISAEGTLVHPMIPGEGFGELALLDKTPRTATVRATEPTVLWSLDRGHFDRWIRDRYEVAARIRASEDERARFAKMPFFSGLGPAELARLSAKLVTRRVPAGEFVFRFGEPGDRYYIIREGTAEVLAQDGRVIRTLGPDAGFGDLALLFGGGRTASVRAVSELVLMGLARKDFAGLVKASGETFGQFRSRTAEYENMPGIGSTVAQAT